MSIDELKRNTDGTKQNIDMGLEKSLMRCHSDELNF